MTKNDYLKTDETIYRILAVKNDMCLVLDCQKKNMPVWKKETELAKGIVLSKEEAIAALGINPIAEELTGEELRAARERYTMIAGICQLLADDEKRNKAIRMAACLYGVSRRTLTTYLCNYLVTDQLASLISIYRRKNRDLTIDEKNMRWALNKFYYTRHKNCISDCYVMMLKEKYTDESGKLKEDHPSIHQFRYFFRKTRKKQTEIISREGIKEYQLNYRPLLGDGVQDFAPIIGTFALDGTICDIYLVDDAGKLIGRPILVAAVDMYCGMCTGYSLLWEGGVYSCRELLLNIITDKVEWCKQHDIDINPEQWDCHELPGTFVTDRGSEYISFNFEQVTELGCQVVSLPSFSANMKGPVEKLFDLIQDSFKPYLRGKGVIEPDFKKRGIRDYRKDASLTLNQFEQIIIYCILYHNNSRILGNFPFTEEMLEEKVDPYSAAIWNHEKEKGNLISVSKKQLILALLPRTEGKFSRYGLKVNKMRYHCEGYTEQYLTGGSVTVAYNPDDVSEVYLVEDDYAVFTLIERRYTGMALEETQNIQKKQKAHTKSYAEEQLQAKIELAAHIETIAAQSNRINDTGIRGVRSTRQKARNERHKDLMKEVQDNA